MEKVTYGAPRYMDWVAQIKAGAATVKVHFTGGALTVYGVTPAEYTTANPFIQKVIEQSKYFRDGRIVVLKRVAMDDGQRQTTYNERQNSNDECRNPEACLPDDFEQVEVDCLQDAQAYLQENYKIASYKIRSKVAAQKAANEHGVMFVFASDDE